MPRTCIREGCDKPITRRDAKYCGRKCYLIDRPKVGPRGPKICVMCGNDYYSAGTESRGTFAGRKTCGPACGAMYGIYNRKDGPPHEGTRFCVICCGKFEANGSNRLTCDDRCANKMRSENAVAGNARHRNAAYRISRTRMKANLRRAEKLYRQYAQQGVGY